MDLESAKKIYALFKDTKHTQLKNELLESAIRYAHIRAQWALISREERLEINQSRTAAHNALIDNCNILSRNMHNSGENNSWRELLGNDRILIGDFACYIHCLLGVSAG